MVGVQQDCETLPHRLYSTDFLRYFDYYQPTLDHINLQPIALKHSHAQQRQQLLDQVCEDHAPVIITRNKSQSVVMMSLEDYEALQEAAYLLRAPKNARRLLESVADLEQDSGQEKELFE